MMPHRKVTLLFPEQDEEQLAARLLDASLSLSHLLHLPLYVVDVSQRSRECRECGFLATSASGPAHVFPWPQAEAQRHLQMAKQWQQHRGAPTPLRIASSSAAAAASDTLPRAAHGPARASKAAAPSAAALPGDGMCNSWRKTKTCPRKDSGRQLCGFKEYAVPVKHCFGFAKGHCEFGAGCKFPHVVGPQLAAGAAADAGAAAAAAASSLDAAAVASASLAPSADSVGVVAASTVAPRDPSWDTARMVQASADQSLESAAAVAPAPEQAAPLAGSSAVRANMANCSCVPRQEAQERCRGRRPCSDTHGCCNLVGQHGRRGGRGEGCGCGVFVLCDGHTTV